MYPGPYRLADVDDIIQNTTGGGVGYLLGWFLVWLLPTRDEIDEHSFRVGTRVSGFRMGLAFFDRLCDAILALRGNRAFRDDSLCSGFGCLFCLIPFVAGQDLGNGFTEIPLAF